MPQSNEGAATADAQATGATAEGQAADTGAAQQGDAQQQQAAADQQNGQQQAGDAGQSLIDGDEGETNGTGNDLLADEGEGEQQQQEPIKYELKFPEGTQVDDAIQENFAKIGNQHRIPQEAMQAMVDLQAQLNAKAIEAQQAEQARMEAEAQQQFEQAKQELQSDPQWPTIKKDARYALDSLLKGDTDPKNPDAPSPADLIRQSGLAANPAFVRALARLGRSAQNDRIGGGSTAGTSPKDNDQMLYPGL
ncbi:MAG: hypothetical protein ACOC00_00180 [Halothiobacillaceae bacterium]